jgi:cytochrome P450
MFEWSDRVARIDSEPEDARVAAMEFWGYSADLIEAIEAGEREAPDALLKTLMGAEVDGEKLELMEIVNFMLLLAIGGNETTRNCISGGFLALHDNPEQLALMRADPLKYSKTAIEEMLRYISPIICFRRTTTQDTELHGQAIPEGSKVVLYYASASRDEDHFENPQAFDITREKNPHLSFGTGQHFCLGATLARMELQYMFEGIFTRLPNLTPTGDTERSDSNYVNATTRMMVRNG